MKRFALFSFGVLCLSLSALIGLHVSETAFAGYVPGGNGVVAWTGANNSAVYLLDEYGATWQVALDGSWSQMSAHSPLPVPVANINFWSADASVAWLLTDTNEVWRFDTGNGEWLSLGVWPGSPPVPTDSQSWGGVKSKYKPAGE